MTVPLQGFLNAIIYGRTTDDFVRMMGTTARFFAQSERGGEIHVIHYSSEYEHDEEGGKGEKERPLVRSQSFSDHGADSPTPLTDSWN